MKTNTKTLAVSLSLMASANVFAGMGGLNVQSNLGEPFSGSIVVTGKEAEALLQNRNVQISGGGISGTVVPQGNGNALIRLRSGSAVHEPVLNFVVKAGNQTRQYTAMVNPSRYKPKASNGVKTVVAQPHTHQEHDEVTHTFADTQNEVIKPTRKVRNKTQRQRFAPMARSANAQYHRVQTGETLAQIAAQYRPHNMSQQRAMRAIMAANPRAFRRGTNGDVMYDGSTLYIPTAAQFQGYAKNGKRSGQRRLSRYRYHAPAAVATTAAIDTVETANTTATPAAPVTPAPVTPPPAPTSPTKPQPAASATTPSAPVKTQPAAPVAAPSTPAATTPVASQTETPKPVSEPAKPATPAVASTPVASEPASTAVAPVTPASTVVASAASTPVASAVTASTPVASAAVASKPKPRPKPVTPPEPEEEESDWLPLALMGLGGAAALGGAAYVLSRRRKNAAEEADDDEFVVVEENTSSAALAAAERVNLNRNAAEPVFNDQDENIFGEAYQPTASSNNANEFDLNNFEPEASSSSDDTDWLTQVEATPQNDWDTGAAFAATAAAGTAFVASQDSASEFDNSEFEISSNTAQTETTSDEDWLNEVFSDNDSFVVESNTPAVADDVVFEEFQTSEPVVAAVESSVPADEFDLSFDISEPAVETVTVEPAVEQDEMAFNLSDTFDQPETPATLAQDIATVDDLAFDIVDTPAADTVNFELDDIATPEPSSFDLAEVPTPTPDEFDLSLPSNNTSDFNLDLPVAENVVADEFDAALVDNLDFNAATDTAASADLNQADDLGMNFATAEADDLILNESVSADELDSLNSLSDMEIGFDEPAASVSNDALDELALSVADDNLSFETSAAPVVEDLSWMNETAQVAPQHDVGFVSEAVGMTAPQEAKMELAKMYLEIDDAVAARETLRELITESSGDLQQQAKQLLEDLGG